MKKKHEGKCRRNGDRRDLGWKKYLPWVALTAPIFLIVGAVGTAYVALYRLDNVQVKNVAQDLLIKSNLDALHKTENILSAMEVRVTRLEDDQEATREDMKELLRTVLQEIKSGRRT